MSAYVKDLNLDSANDYSTAVIVISRRVPGSHRPRASDLPDDLRGALLRWLGCETPQSASAPDISSYEMTTIREGAPPREGTR
jgi:hypothetical protein